MKILMMVSSFFPASVGGAERQCWRQAQALVRRGHEVLIITKWLDAASVRSEMMDGVRIWRRGCFFSVRKALRQCAAYSKTGNHKQGGARPVSPLGEALPTRSRWQAISERARNVLFMMDVVWGLKTGLFKADVVHVHESHWVAGFAQWIGERMGVPVFCKEATQPVLGYDNMTDVPWKTKWKSCRMKCRFIAMTDAIFNELVGVGIPTHHIVSVPNGVEIPDEVAEPGQHAEALYVGNFTQGAGFKGFDVLLQAWGMAQRQEPGMRLRLYGRGDTHIWKTYAAEHGCGNSVVFERETNDIWAAHRQSGFLVIPSRQEGLSNALLEAMASGLPSVVSDIPGNTAAVRNRIEGIVVPVGNPSVLADAIVEMYCDSELRMRMGRSARERAQTTFSLDSVAKKLELAYAQAIEEEVHVGKATLSLYPG